MTLDHYLIPYTKIKMYYRFVCKMWNHKTPKENIHGNKLLDIDPGIDFLELTPKAKATKVNINKWYYIQLKGFV